jgi:hypothetical protein
MSEQVVELGDVVKDPITGAQGTVMAITHYLTGCDRASVQLPGLTKESKLIDWLAFDLPQLKIIKKKTPPAKKRITGGPQPAVYRR